MNESDYQAMLRKPAVARRNPVGGQTQDAKPERAVCHEPVAEAQRKAADASRFSVRITSFRRRLIDPDNLCPKYFVDCLRYAGYIPNDRAQDITLSVNQIKVQFRANEGTEIIVTTVI